VGCGLNELKPNERNGTMIRHRTIETLFNVGGKVDGWLASLFTQTTTTR